MQCGFLGASSEPSWQSNSPSHSHFFWLRQRPLAQRNSSGPHVGYSTPEEEYVHQVCLKAITTLNCPAFCSVFLHISSGSQPLTTLWGFIRAIGAVNVVITHKVLGDTLSVLAHELVIITRAVGVHWKGKEHTLVNWDGTWLVGFGSFSTYNIF